MINGTGVATNDVNAAKTSERFADIIRVLHSGIEFYEEALEKVESSELKHVFAKVSLSHKKSVARLQPYVVIVEGGPEASGAFSVEARKMYTKLLAALSGNKDLALVDQLEEVEDKLLEKVREARVFDMAPACASALDDVRIDVKLSHDLMRRAQRRQELAD